MFDGTPHLKINDRLIGRDNPTYFIADIAASLINDGVSKSGSPAPKPITSFPAALNSLAFCVTAIVGDGFILFKLFEIMLIEIKINSNRFINNAEYLSRFNY